MLLSLPILKSPKEHGSGAAGVVPSAALPLTVQAPAMAGTEPKAAEVMPVPLVTKARRAVPSSRKPIPAGSRSCIWKLVAVPSGRRTTSR